MTDFSKFTRTGKTTNFSNGKKLSVYSKETKTGVRYYYFASTRMIPISKKEII